ncbi:MAG: DUF4062 domain-containing protein [Anaerolineae bacterium]|nr:DUF4062 domain-containing protein [Anaerolineae bacterium]
MPGPICLFISSSPDLVAEREALGQAVAELPISVGFEIMHAQVGEATDIGEALAFIERCDLYVIVLGADFAAPMGIKWQRAQEARKPTLAYAKRALHSPSAQKLLRDARIAREAGVAWEPFESPQALKAHATRALAQLLFDQGESFGLHVDDVDGLLAVLDEKNEKPAEKPDRREGGSRSRRHHLGTRELTLTESLFGL